MTDNILSAALVFSLMVGGTAAIGSEMVAGRHDAASTTTVTLAPVTITGRRAVPTEVAIDTHQAKRKVE